MLARENRLSSNTDIKLVQKTGRMSQSDNFSLLILDKNEDRPSRFAAVISTKISPLATTRNKVKRSLYEGVRHITAFVKPGHDIVFLVKPGIERKYTDDLMREVKSAFDKANLLKE